MATSAQVQQLYIALLGRAADKPGLDWWLENINGTEGVPGERTLEEAAAAFTTSEEFVSTYGSLQGAELVTAVYSNLFERTPSAEEVAYWVNDGRPADQLLSAFLTYASPADQAVINNKVTVAQYYTEAAGADYDLDDAAAIIADVDGTAASVSTALNNLPVSNATVHAAVVKLLNANAAVEANVEAWGEANNDADPSAAKIYAALAAAEAAVATAAADADLGISGTTQTALNTVETAGFATYNSADAAEALALNIARSEIATKKLALDGDLSSAVTGLEAVSTSDKPGSLKALIDNYLAKLKAASTAQTTEDAAGVTLAGKAAEADIVLDSALDSAGKDYQFDVTATGGVVVFANNSLATDDFGAGDYRATYDAATDKWTYALDTGSGYGNLSDAEVTADAALQKLLANATAKSLLDAAAANAEAIAATNAAETAVVAELTKIEAVNSGLTSATGASAFGDTLAGAAVTYQNAVQALADHAAAKTAFDEAVAGVEAVRGDAAALAALEKAASDASDVLGTLATVGVIGPVSSGTSADDLFIFDGKTGGTISAFGTEGNDKIYFGTDFTLVTLADDQVITDNLGSSSALEIFYDASLAKLYVEKQAFGGNSVGTSEIVEITLAGVTEGVELSADGYLTVA